MTCGALKEKLMHIAGINWVAVLTAAASFFVIGFVIHLRLVDLKAWDAAKHTDQAKPSTPIKLN
jgi:hypothetical protein